MKERRRLTDAEIAEIRRRRPGVRASLACEGMYLTAVIGLPQGFNASNLIPSSIRLNQTLVALRVTQVTQLSKAPILIAKFNMTQVKALLSNPGLYVLKIRGNILTSKSFRPFEATSTIRLLPT